MNMYIYIFSLGYKSLGLKNKSNENKVIYILSLEDI